ncbi:MAG: DUF99 family protein [Labilithrix sp.]|nr:DUF99 family protein [Labilithrix sp.]
MNVIGFDDGPFPREHRGDVLLVGVVCSGTRVDGIVSGRVRRDGADATRRMVELVRASQFGHVQAVMLQGIAVGGFNVVDIHGLSKALHLPVLIVVRRPPDIAAVRRALFSDAPSTARPRVPGAARKWRLIEQAGALEVVGPSRRALKRASGLQANGPKLWIQRAGLSLEEARRIVTATTLHGNIPEPLRVAHLIAGGITTGKSRGRA